MKKRAKRYIDLEQAHLDIQDKYPGAKLCRPNDEFKWWHWILIIDGKRYCVADASPYSKKWHVFVVDVPIPIENGVPMKDGKPLKKLRQRSTKNCGRPREEKAVYIRTPIGIQNVVNSIIDNYKQRTRRKP